MKTGGPNCMVLVQVQGYPMLCSVIEYSHETKFFQLVVPMTFLSKLDKFVYCSEL